MSGTGTAGITAGGLSRQLLTITHCTVRGFNEGIRMGGEVEFLIADTVVTNNQTGIIDEQATGTLDHVVLYLNSSTGVFINQGNVTAVDTFANNNGAAFVVRGSITLARSTATKNVLGVSFLSGHGISFGDNHIRGNGSDVTGGTLTNVGTQ